MKPTAIPEACNLVAQILSNIAKEIGTESLYGKVFGEVHIEGEDWTCDSCVELMQGFRNGGKGNTGYCITPMIEKRAAGSFRQGQEYVRYYIQHEEVTSGGRDEPDSSDLVDDLATDSPHEAAKKVFLLYVEHEINRMFEAEAEAALAEADEDYQREMYDWHYCKENDDA